MARSGDQRTTCSDQDAGEGDPGTWSVARWGAADGGVADADNGVDQLFSTDPAAGE